MRLALIEDQTVLCRIASKSEPLFISSPFVRQNENKRPCCVFPTSEAFSYAGEAYGSFIVQALSLTWKLRGAAAPVEL